MTVAQLKKRMDGRFTQLERRMNARFGAVGVRLDAMEQRFDGRLDAMDGRLDDMSRSHDARFASLERHLISLGDKLDSITRRLDGTMKGHWKLLNEREDRIQDLERAERARLAPRN